MYVGVCRKQHEPSISYLTHMGYMYMWYVDTRIVSWSWGGAAWGKARIYEDYKINYELWKNYVPLRACSPAPAHGCRHSA